MSSAIRNCAARYKMLRDKRLARGDEYLSLAAPKADACVWNEDAGKGCRTKDEAPAGMYLYPNMYEHPSSITYSSPGRGKRTELTEGDEYAMERHLEEFGRAMRDVPPSVAFYKRYDHNEEYE